MVDLYPHQQKAIDQMHNGCILVGDVGTGKTLTSIAYFYTKECKGVLHDYNTMREPKDLYIITTAKKRDSKDWEGDAALLGIGGDPSISAGGVKLTVDSWNNIARYKDVKDAFFIFDEQRVVGAGHWSKMFVKIAKQNRFILLSATPGDTWLDYIPIFLANGFYKNRTAFKDEHVVYNTFAKFPKVERYTGVGKLVKYRNQVLVNMPYERHTTRHLKVVNIPYDESTFEKVVKDRWHVYEGRPIRDVAELFSVMRKVVNSHESRGAQLVSLLAKHPKLIVFYNFDYELEALRQLFECSTRSDSSMCLTEDTSRLTGSISTRSDNLKNSGSSRVSTPNRPIDRGVSTSLSPTSKSGTGSTRTIRSTDHIEGMMNPSRLYPTGTTTPKVEGSSGNAQQLIDRVETARKAFTEAQEVRETLGKLDQGVRTASSLMDSTSPNTASTQGRVELSGGSFAVAEWNGHKHEEIPKTDSWVYLVQYTAGAEGWNCIETDAMVFHSLTYSYKQFHQAQGRIDRLNTPFNDLYYYIFMSDSMIDKAISKSLKVKKSFNERQFMGQFG